MNVFLTLEPAWSDAAKVAFGHCPIAREVVPASLRLRKELDRMSPLSE